MKASHKQTQYSAPGGAEGQDALGNGDKDGLHVLGVADKVLLFHDISEGADGEIASNKLQ